MPKSDDQGTAAAAGFAEDFTVRTDPYRRELLAHCYRMLGSVHDAEDLLQETLLRAWRAYGRYDPGRASLRTWLHRIATNACLTALEQRSRRPLPAGLGTPPNEDPDHPLVRGEEVPWLQPIPDAWLGGGGGRGAGPAAGRSAPGGSPQLDPAEVVSARGSLRLAFVAALQYLPARQRAVLILREVLEWPAAEVAAALGMTVPAVNSALQRARARLREAGPSEERLGEPADPGERAVVERYAAAFEKADLTALRKLLAEDVVLEMPPFLDWFAGREHYVRFIARVYTTRGTDWRLLPTGANGQPALAAYLRAPDGDGHRLHTLQVFTVAGSLITRNDVFRDEGVFTAFGLPDRLR